MKTKWIGALLWAGVMAAHAQNAPGVSATEAAPPNPFAAPLNALRGELVNAPALRAPIAPPPPALPALAGFAGTGQADDGVLDRLVVQYIIGDEGRLQVSGNAPGESNGRAYLVKHNRKVKIGSRWVLPVISDGVVALYDELPESVRKQKAQRAEHGALLWSGGVQVDSGLAPSATAPVANDAPQTVGAIMISPSQRAIGSGGSGGIGTFGAATSVTTTR